jgi:hypothetical protein
MTCTGTVCIQSVKRPLARNPSRKRPLAQQGQQLGRDAPRQEDAARRARRQGQIARRLAVDRREQMQASRGDGVRAGQAGLADGLGRMIGGQQGAVG